jgi:hypothetical protein
MDPRLSEWAGSNVRLRSATIPRAGIEAVVSDRDDHNLFVRDAIRDRVRESAKDVAVRATPNRPSRRSCDE